MASKMIAKDAKASLFCLRSLILAGGAGSPKTSPFHGGELIGQVLRISTQKPIAQATVLLRRRHAYEEDHPSKIDIGVGRLGGGGDFGVSDARIRGMNYYSGLEAQAGRGSRRVVNDDDKDDDDDHDDGGDDGVYDSEDDLMDSDGDVEHDDTLRMDFYDDD